MKATQGKRNEITKVQMKCILVLKIENDKNDTYVKYVNYVIYRKWRLSDIHELPELE